MICEFDFKYGVGNAVMSSRLGWHCDYSEHLTEEDLLGRDSDIFMLKGI